MAKARFEFKIIGIKPGKYRIPGWGVVDLKNLSDAQAKRLIAKKFPYIEKVKKES